jgi:hypothetical protein
VNNLHRPILSDIEKARKPTKKQGKNPHVKKVVMLWKDASTEPGSQSSKYGIA